MQKGWPLVLGVCVVVVVVVVVCLNFFGIFFWVQTDMQKGWPLVFWTGNAKCKCKMQIQMKNFLPKLKSQIFHPNKIFSPEPKIFARTQNSCPNPKFLPKPKIQNANAIGSALNPSLQRPCCFYYLLCTCGWHSTALLVHIPSHQ